jgi:hypothetical protein
VSVCVRVCVRVRLCVCLCLSVCLCLCVRVLGATGAALGKLRGGRDVELPGKDSQKYFYSTVS